MSSAIDFDEGDSLDDLLGGQTAPATIQRPQPPAHYTPPSFTEKCPKCRGTGRFGSYGPCFTCQGRGSRTFKTSSETRARSRGNYSANKARKEAERRAEVETQIEAFKAANPEAYAWLLENVEKFDFATSLWNALRQYGALTEAQLAAVNRCIEKRKAAKEAAAQREANAPTVTITKIEEAFAAAYDNGLQWPKLRLDTFTFSPAGPNSKWHGSIYVKEGEQYLGRITAGKFVCTRECGDDRQTRVLAAAADPEAAAVAYGKRTGSCSCCARELTNAESIERGIGPICATKYGW